MPSVAGLIAFLNVRKYCPHFPFQILYFNALNNFHVSKDYYLNFWQLVVGERLCVALSTKRIVICFQHVILVVKFLSFSEDFNAVQKNI